MASRWMERALSLARRGLGHTSPNPLVGAVIVDAEDHLLAEGYHRRAGGAHAEIAALKKAGTTARGATLYVTLEPCNHTGRTPPCTEAIIASGIRRVVVAIADPNPHVTGGGIARLLQAGLTVSVGDGANLAEKLNGAFLTWSRYHRPWITLKAAISLDGKIADESGASKYLTSQKALEHAHRLRREHDAILVGSGTVLTDNPRLTYRGTVRGHDPIRVVLDTRGRIGPDAQVFDPGASSPCLVFTGDETSVDWERSIFSSGGEVIRVAIGADGHVSIPEVLQHLADRRILSVLVEGGARIHGAFVDHQWVDRWVGYIAPLILGGSNAPSAVAGKGLPLQAPMRLEVDKVFKRGPDVMIDARVITVASKEASLSDVIHQGV